MRCFEGGPEGEPLRHRPIRMTHDRENDAAFEDFLELWRKLLADSLVPGTVVVVEGERDRRSLRRLGLAGAIVAVHEGQTLSGTAQRLTATSRRVILLTDWDSEGGRLAHRLKEFLSAERLDLDLDYRRRLASALRGELVHVEGLAGWARRNAERAQGVDRVAARPRRLGGTRGPYGMTLDWVRRVSRRLRARDGRNRSVPLPDQRRPRPSVPALVKPR